MYTVYIPRYSHEGSGATREHSSHESEGQANAERERIKASYRFVLVRRTVDRGEFRLPAFGHSL